MTANATAILKAWIEPEIAALEIDETQLVPNVGADGGRFADCTRS
jgi:hypothetical protein